MLGAEIVGALESPKVDKVVDERLGVNTELFPEVVTVGTTDCVTVALLVGLVVGLVVGLDVAVLPVGLGAEPPPLQATSEAPMSVLAKSSRRFNEHSSQDGDVTRVINEKSLSQPNGT